ncbi:MAG: CCA tRNA nucleotidyltransferase, partial [Phenylobacterium sp.]|uniref:CCA tRNA nucleotidyltransferase n=1 Tax=Phenylobacterium sp. TaxID=1871053 RepID=UPI0027366208
MINLAAAWIADPRTIAVMDALEAAGGAGCARFVGGAVRNALLGAEVDDIDIATTLTPQAVSAALAAASLRAVPTGIDHGTVTAISGGRPFEITTLRRDVATDGRHAVVAFTDDWALDAGRRDFTMNALYADRAGAVLDPTGIGVADALAGRVAFVGDPQTRIREDYLRVMRFFRFHAWYGAGEPDRAALAACAALKGPVAALAAERVSKELLKLLAAEDPRAALAAMAETGVLAIAAPGLENLGRLSGLVEVEAQLMAEPDAGLRLAALLDDDPPASAAFAQRLRLSNALRDRLAAALDPSLTLTSWMSPREA